MDKRQPSPKHLTPDDSRHAAYIFHTSWGWMGVSETKKGINAVILPKASRQTVLSELQAASASLLDTPITSRLRDAQAQLSDYLAGTRRSFDLSLDLSRGTNFQQRVWQTLRRISYGQLRSYQWVAAHVGGRRYARAVGNAVGANPIPIVIPCHRIVAQDASLGGFSGGLPTKRKLLTLEGTLAKLRRGRS